MKQSRPLILLLGVHGQVAWELRRSLAPLGTVVTGGRSGADRSLDLAVPGDAGQVIGEVKPALVVNAAAYTAVDKAESEPELARRINELALSEIAQAAREQDCPVVHYSTDYVFSGAADTPWRETHAPAPRSVYGTTKLGGESALAAAGADHLVLRTAWVYGTRGGNFLLTMQRLFRERDQLGVVHDQMGAPTWCRHIADATAQILAQCRSGDGNGFVFGRRGGIYHLSAAGSTSWYGFAAAIREETAASCELRPISTADYPTPARRPAYSVLDNDKLAATFGVCLPDWRDSLALCLQGAV